jgi:hypothetical protein
MTRAFERLERGEDELRPRLALEPGAPLAIVNLTETPLDGAAEVVARAKAGNALGAAD